MSFKGLVLIGMFGLCAVGALFLPHLGIYGYLADYCVNPAGQWWGAPFANMGVRFSFTLATATALGIVLQYKNLKFGDSAFYGQELLLLLFLAVMWGLYFVSPATVGRYTTIDHPTIKIAKIVIFTLMMTHVITDIKKISGLFWVLASVSLLLGIKARDLPYSRFIGGRLEGIGGADFAEANFFAAFMAAMLPIIAIQFLRSGLAGKLYCVVCGAFTANAVILCRSRGAFLGLAFGALAACVFAPQKHRKRIAALLIVGVLGVGYLTDTFFLERILSITTQQEEMDISSSSRIQLWKAGAKVFINHPLGIGPGNWYQTIGHYLPEYEGKDSHNTYVKCAVELGILGVSAFMLIILQAYFNLKKVHANLGKLPAEDSDDFAQLYFAMVVSLVVILVCGLTITMIYTEIVWLLLMLPICLRRAFDNRMLEIQPNNLDQLGVPTRHVDDK